MKKIRYKGTATEVRIPKDGADHHLKANVNNDFTIEVSNDQAERILQNNPDAWEEAPKDGGKRESGAQSSNVKSSHSPVTKNAVSNKDGDTEDDGEDK